MDVDTTKPNGGRIYDYMLGGNHNFEVDRIAAERILQFFPSMKNGMRTARWFMYDAVERMAQEKFPCYLDLATGIPTQGYIHELVPEARIIYNDRDPVTVAYGRQIIGDNPNVHYIQSDIASIDTIVAAAEEFFGRERRIGISFIGVAYFLTDATLQKVIDRLYNWCAPGSQMAMTWLVGDPANPRNQEVLEMYNKMGASVMLRDIPTITGFLQPWRIMEPGLVTLTEWLDLETWNEAGHDDSNHIDAWGVMLEKA